MGSYLLSTGREEGGDSVRSGAPVWDKAKRPVPEGNTPRALESHFLQQLSPIFW